MCVATSPITFSLLQSVILNAHLLVSKQEQIREDSQIDFAMGNVYLHIWGGRGFGKEHFFFMAYLSIFCWNVSYRKYQLIEN